MPRRLGWMGSLGYLPLQDVPSVTAAILSFVTGGILYLILQPIAPRFRERRRWLPPPGAVFGFAIGMVGTQLLR